MNSLFLQDTVVALQHSGNPIVGLRRYVAHLNALRNCARIRAAAKHPAEKGEGTSKWLITRVTYQYSRIRRCTSSSLKLYECDCGQRTVQLKMLIFYSHTWSRWRRISVNLCNYALNYGRKIHQALFDYCK